MFEGYRISSNKENWNQCFDVFDSKQEAIKGAKEQYKKWKAGLATDIFDEFDENHPSIYFYIAKSHSYDPIIDAEQVIYNIQENAFFEGGDYSEGYLEDVAEKDIDELVDILTEAYIKWETKNNYKANFFNITDIERISLYLK